MEQWHRSVRMAERLDGREMRRVSGVKIKMEGEQVIERREPLGLRAERHTGSLGQETFWNHALTVRDPR